MPSANQIIEMLRSHFAGDEERFRTAALQMAANEARMGHESVARDIQQVLEKAKTNQFDAKLRPNSIAFNAPTNQLAGLLESVEPRFGLKSMVIAKETRDRLDRVVKEHRQFNRLHEFDLHPRQRILLLGPPGCGKTMTAHALAHELSLPLFIVRLDAIFTKYLGETAAKLRLIFDSVERQRAVFLFDEFDSIGLSRGSQHDVAEMRRVLNSFLVFIENMRGMSLVIAASNHAEALDPALFRRFDDIVEYNMPTDSELLALMKRRLAEEPQKPIEWPRVLKLTSGMSFADAEKVVDEAVKERIIENLQFVNTALLLKTAKERKKRPRGLRK